MHHHRDRRRRRAERERVRRGFSETETRLILEFLSRVLSDLKNGSLDVESFENFFPLVGIPSGKLVVADPEIALLQCFSRLCYHFHNGAGFSRRHFRIFWFKERNLDQRRAFSSFSSLAAIWEDTRLEKWGLDDVMNLSDDVSAEYAHRIVIPNHMTCNPRAQGVQATCWHFSLLADEVANYLYLQGEESKRIPGDNPLCRFVNGVRPVVSPLSAPVEGEMAAAL
ncbi:MAG: hypothetical protein PHV42_04155 [Candidatus Pacebacteria bacterium]|nr:hypothetical protein [Candidatus Paceibacterota bacterium]